MLVGFPSIVSKASFWQPFRIALWFAGQLVPAHEVQRRATTKAFHGGDFHDVAKVAAVVNRLAGTWVRALRVVPDSPPDSTLVGSQP